MFKGYLLQNFCAAPARGFSVLLALSIHFLNISSEQRGNIGFIHSFPNIKFCGLPLLSRQCISAALKMCISLFVTDGCSQYYVQKLFLTIVYTSHSFFTKKFYILIAMSLVNSHVLSFSSDSTQSRQNLLEALQRS